MYLIKAKHKLCVFNLLPTGEDNSYDFDKDTLFITDGVVLSPKRLGWINNFIVVTALDDCKSYEHHVLRAEAHQHFKAILNLDFEIVCEF